MEPRKKRAIKGRAVYLYPRLIIAQYSADGSGSGAIFQGRGFYRVEKGGLQGKRGSGRQGGRIPERMGEDRQREGGASSWKGGLPCR